MKLSFRCTQMMRELPGRGNFGVIIKPIYLFSCVLAAAVFFTACQRKEAAAGKGKRQSGPVPVLVGKVVQQDVPSQVRAIGNVTAYSTVAVRSRVSGELMKVHFNEGQEVKRGDLLFTIDPRVPMAALQQARANLARDEAVVNQARTELDRERKLLESRLISQDEFDKAESAWKTAVANTESTKAAVTNAALTVEFTSIRSPLEGKTGTVLVRQGNQVNAESDVLVTINQVHPIYVVFSVPEQHLAEIRKESQEKTLKVEARLADWHGPSPHGELTFIDNAVDVTTGTIQLKATFANTDHALWPGQFVQVTLTLRSLSQVTVVPSQAVQAGQNGDYVYVVKADQTVEARPVLTAMTFEGGTVVTNGLKVGETIVLDGQLRLGPGAKVSVKTTEKPEGTNAALARDGK
jgi:membrane fusion protein, multidrug efflux system